MKDLASIVGGFIVVALLAVAALYFFTIPTGDVTLQDIPVRVASTATRGGTGEQKINMENGKETEGEKEEKGDFFLIVGSVRDPDQARKKALELKNVYNTDFTVLPPTPEGYYRISCGRFPTLGDAKSAIKDIRAKINPDAWILSLKNEP